MCGIVGYVGPRTATPLLVEGLKRLEYRGYDSAGVAIMNGAGVETVKEAGKISRLEAMLASNPVQGTTGIAHTRWATHGPPNQVNAHPQVSTDGSIAVVHNGIIENATVAFDFGDDFGAVSVQADGAFRRRAASCTSASSCRCLPRAGIAANRQALRA
jgi:glutamine phosphoribosylpyrophosphate amidotransferase